MSCVTLSNQHAIPEGRTVGIHDTIKTVFHGDGNALHGNEVLNGDALHGDGIANGDALNGDIIVNGDALYGDEIARIMEIRDEVKKNRVLIHRPSHEGEVDTKMLEAQMVDQAGDVQRILYPEASAGPKKNFSQVRNVGVELEDTKIPLGVEKGKKGMEKSTISPEVKDGRNSSDKSCIHPGVKDGSKREKSTGVMDGLKEKNTHARSDKDKNPKRIVKNPKAVSTKKQVDIRAEPVSEETEDDEPPAIVKYSDR